MKNCKRLLLNLHLLINAYAVANTSNSAYLKIAAGLAQSRPLKSNLHTSKKPGKITAVLASGIGYEINQCFRSDISFSTNVLHYYKKSTPGSDLSTRIDTQTIKTYSILAQLYVSPDKIFSPILPFIVFGCGAGYNKVGNFKSASASNSNAAHMYFGRNNLNFIWSIGGGVIFNDLSKNYSAEIALRYIDFGKIKVTRARQSLVVSPFGRSTKPKPGFYTPRLSAYQVTAAVNIYL